MNNFRKNINLGKRWKGSSIFFLIIFIISLIGLYLLIFPPKFLFQESHQPPVITEENDVKVADCPDCQRRLLDGVLVEEGTEINSWPVAVIIDNQEEAWPNYGLAQADLVYEAEVEGKITRYLAIFSGLGGVDKIGPVRSVRPYFLDWAEEISALLVHVGGSPAALARIGQEDIVNLNEFYQGDYFWRDYDLDGPHNIFIFPNKLERYLQLKELKEANFSSWQYKDDLEKENRNDSSRIIKIGYKEPYNVAWRYDLENNSYSRFLGDESHLAGGDEDIRAKNIIIQYIDSEVIDNKLRLKLNLWGAGKAVFCLDGFCQPGQWRKDRNEDRTKYYAESGEEIVFNAGPTWIEVVDGTMAVQY